VTHQQAPRYTAVAIGLHWLVFALVLAAWALGLTMVDLPLARQKLELYSWHRWIGVTVFLLALPRLAWRALHPAPPPPAAMPAWERRAAAAAHALLYVLMLATPVSGWLFSSASGVTVVCLGLLPLPDPAGRNEALAEFAKPIHVLLNAALFLTACLHAAAALKHHFVDRDAVLARMVPFIKGAPSGIAKE